MLEPGKPLPEVLDHVIASGLLPSAVAVRARRLAMDVQQGRPLADSLARRGLATQPLRGLIAAAERARNLPWALQEIGDALMRRGSRLANRLAQLLFPLAVFGCACSIAVAAVAMFQPLITVMDSLHGK
jgi:type II secretory pathway component PulF